MVRCFLLGHDIEIMPIANRPRNIVTGRPYLGIAGTRCVRCGMVLSKTRFPGLEVKIK